MGRREDKKLEKRSRLDEAGVQELLSAGYAGATVERIVAAADVARGTFYLYYSDKHALFAVLLERLYGPLVAALATARDALAADTAPPVVYAELGEALATLIGGQPALTQVALREARAAGPGGEAVRAWTAQVEGLTEEILAASVERGLLRPHAVRPVALAIVGGVERLTWGWLAQEGGLDPAVVTMELIGLFTYGLARG